MKLFSTKYGVFPVLLFALSFILFSSCEKFIETEPEKDDFLWDKKVFETDAMATSAMIGVYTEMSKAGFASGDFRSITYLTSFSADELTPGSSFYNIEGFYKNTLAPGDYSISNLWNSFYSIVYACNATIEGLKSSTTLTPAIKDQLQGEALFIRAFSYFYLVNLFGDVPLAISTDFKKNQALARSSATSVYEKIEEDLLEAESLLTDDYSVSDGRRIRANKGAAQAMLARTYLYTEDWIKAETYASKVINKSSLYDLPTNLNNVFLANSSEAIWQLQPVQTPMFTNEGSLFIAVSSFSSGWLTGELLNAFEPNDDRRTQWVGTYTNSIDNLYYPFKYKLRNVDYSRVEYSMVLRLAEQYLIRAEARAQQGKLTGSGSAAADINVIRMRAELSLTGSTTKEELLTDIEQERRVELFTEWGHRWLDLKRWNRADDVLEPVKSPDWDSTDALYPIPQSERDKVPNLSQNPGYSNN